MGLNVFDDYEVEGQISLFDYSTPMFKITKPIRLIELFAGVGSQAMALRDLGADFEHYRVVEFDKYAIKSYNAVHGTDFQTMDITKTSGSDLGIVDTINYCYIMTYSFPCQDLSVAGLGKGMTKGSGTRSGLLWEVERLINEVDNLPQVLLMENVPQVHGKKNIDDFRKWIQFLENKGYSNYWQDLNAKNYGVAQNRNRCFMVSILGNYKYEFPKPIELTKRMKDYLEDEVDEKYYINDEKAQKLINTLTANGTILDRQSTCPTNKGEGSKIIVAMRGRNPNNPSDRTVGAPTEQRLEPNSQGICNTLTSVQKDNLVMEVKEIGQMDNTIDHTFESKWGKNKNVSLDTYISEALETNTELPCAIDEQNVTIRKDDTVGALSTNGSSAKRNNRVLQEDLRIRKLTPLECWRLMNFSDEDFQKAESVNSNTQLYKQAGNSIVKNVLVAIIGQMIPGKENVYKERGNGGNTFTK